MDDLILAYFGHAQVYYVKHSRPTSEQDNIRLQLLCGGRPQEVTALRPCEVTRADDGVWYYHPGAHKMEHAEREKVIVLGPRAQKVLRPWLDRDAESLCFSPAESASWQLARQRKRPAEGGAAAKAVSSRGKRKPGTRYTRHSYRTCIQRACRRAKVPVWSPRQLATRARPRSARSTGAWRPPRRSWVTRTRR